MKKKDDKIKSGVIRMRCPECNEVMRSDAEEKKYICDCNYEIEWMGEYEVNAA